jgi:hypothetical protein
METYVLRWTKSNLPVWQGVDDHSNLVVISQVADVINERNRLRVEIKRLRETLQEISQGYGRYSMDPLTHASNTIDDMKQLAIDALTQEQDDE